MDSPRSTARRLELTPEARTEVERVARDGPRGIARRARIIVARADGAPLSVIARSVGLHRDSVRRWLNRYHAQGLAGLQHGNAGKPKNVVFDAAARAEINRRADTSPAMLGEPFNAWSLYKLRDHLVHQRVVASISVERLRQLLATSEHQREFWRRGKEGVPISPEVRHQLVELVRHPRIDQARRARAVLAIADGASISAVAHTFHLGKGRIRRWLDHFLTAGVAGLSGSATEAANMDHSLASFSGAAPPHYSPAQRR